jgi:hypothetical protein
MTNPPSSAGDRAPAELLKQAESALRRLGFSRVTPKAGPGPEQPAFWVQEPGVPRRSFAVFVQQPGAPTAPWEQWVGSDARGAGAGRAIVVVPS